MEAPQNPAGAYVAEESYGPARRDELIAVIEAAPDAMRNAVAGLSKEQLDTRYRNWTIRQIVHHVADSHLHSYIRFKWTLTENHPTIKAYDESLWSEMADARSGDVRAPLAMLEGIHARWVQLMRSMSDAQFALAFHHPETDKDVGLSAALSQYAWHCKHHTGQITWLREQRGW
jgi:hypothetical protein